MKKRLCFEAFPLFFPEALKSACVIVLDTKPKRKRGSSLTLRVYIAESVMAIWMDSCEPEASPQNPVSTNVMAFWACRKGNGRAEPLHLKANPGSRGVGSAIQSIQAKDVAD